MTFTIKTRETRQQLGKKKEKRYLEEEAKIETVRNRPFHITQRSRCVEVRTAFSFIIFDCFVTLSQE
jgi:hypothetical protein